jgi:hypothetical protein
MSFPYLRIALYAAMLPDVITGAAKAQTMSEPAQQITHIVISAEGISIPATLNGTLTAREFIQRLPMTIDTQRGEFDFCGKAEPLGAEKSETQAGWRNGDIGYSRGWFALFVDGQEQSKSYTSEMIIGHIDDGYLEAVRNLGHSVRFEIERVSIGWRK